MRSVVLSIAGICVCAALCEQLMGQNRYFRLIRMALGMRLAGTMIRLAIYISRKIT